MSRRSVLLLLSGLIASPPLAIAGCLCPHAGAVADTRGPDDSGTTQDANPADAPDTVGLTADALAALDALEPPTDASAVADTGPWPDATEPADPCCLVPSDLPGGSAARLTAPACAAACGTVAAAQVCEDPPRCCVVPARQDEAVVRTATECADLEGVLTEDSACTAWTQTVCCRWEGAPYVDLELDDLDCAARAGREVLGDYCWDQVALGTECCLLPSGLRRIIADYQCEPAEGGHVVPRATCWQPPSTGTCCTFACRPPRYAEDEASCRGDGGTPSGWAACAPPGALLP